MALWALEFTELERELRWQHCLGGRNTKESMEIPCSLTDFCFAGTFLQAPCSQNQFPRVWFGFLVLSGMLPSPQSPKGLQGLFSASGPLQSALLSPGFNQGKQTHQMKSVCLELSPSIYPFWGFCWSISPVLQLPSNISLTKHIFMLQWLLFRQTALPPHLKNHENPGSLHGST